MRALLFAALLLAAAHPVGAQTEAEQPSVADLIVRFNDDTLSDDDALRLLAVAVHRPDAVWAAGGDPQLVREVLRESYPSFAEDEPRTTFAKALQAYRDSDGVRGDSLFARAVGEAESDGHRANLYYSRGASRFGPGLESDIEAALRLDPAHGPALYRRAGLIANSVGRPSSLRGRFAYWCLADIYRRVASTTDDERIGGIARRAAAQYDRAAPNPDDYADLGVQPGDPVDASLGAYGRCATTVR